MPSTPVSLVPATHKGLKVSQNGNAQHLAANHLAKVYWPEFVRAGADYPIIFMKNPESGQMDSLLIWGIQPGENLYVEDDKWVGGFVPASVRCFPFTMTTHPDKPDRLFIGLYEDSVLVNKEDGELIFNDDGSETKWMTSTKEFLTNVFAQETMTQDQIKELDDMGLFVSQSLTYKQPGDDKEKMIDGFYVIDKTKLSELSDEEFLKLRKVNVLEGIYAHLASLNNINKILAQKNIRDGIEIPSIKAD